MPAPLLETKLYVPRPRHGLVPRPRLLERVDDEAAWKLMLVSAPAGFGKTTLLAEWLAGTPFASTGQRSAVAVARQGRQRSGDLLGLRDRRAPHGGTGSRHERARTPRGAATATHQPALTPLLNDLGSLDVDLVLVLDDYHVINSREVQDGVAFLLDHLPRRLRLVIVSRADPPLPLPRMRARGELIEIRAAELRFTTQEAAAYLNGVVGLQLTAPDVAALEERTEGWVAALQLAALSMQGRADVPGFIAGFTGDDRYIVDYLAEEVLQRQPEHVRAFLLATSLLSRLTGSLCDAVTATSGGKAMLEALDRDNLFLVPLDDRRQWYRYHHLFADVLRARLSEETPEIARELHRRASDWYAANGERSEAIRHAIGGQHFERAAELVELAPRPAQGQAGDHAAWLARADARRPARGPAGAQQRPCGGAAVHRGDRGVERHLRDAERWLAGPGDTRERTGLPGTRMVVADDEELHRLPAGIAVHRAGLALRLGDLSTTVIQARRALDLLEEDDDVGRGGHRADRTRVLGERGSRGGARGVRRLRARMRRAGHLSDVLGCSITLADLRITQGRLRDAADLRAGVAAESGRGVPVLRERPTCTSG